LAKIFQGELGLLLLLTKPSLKLVKTNEVTNLNLTREVRTAMISG